MERRFAAEHLKPTLHKGADLLARIDRFIRPRLLILTGSVTINRCNGLLIMLAALLLMLPLGAIPFTNAMPAWAILLLAIGMLQRDGLLRRPRLCPWSPPPWSGSAPWPSACWMAGQNISTLFG